VVDCTEVAEDIMKFCGEHNDPSGCSTSWEFFDWLRDFQLANEQIRKPKGVLPVRESEPACSHSYDSCRLPCRR
jgi:hypothetical protein